MIGAMAFSTITKRLRIAVLPPVTAILFSPALRNAKMLQIVTGGVCLLVFYLRLAVSTPATSAPIVWVIGDKLDWETWLLAGWNATNCGRVPVGADAQNASDCVLSANRDHKPFRVRYQSTAADEASAFSIVGARDGRLYHVAFLGGSPDGGVDLFRQYVTTFPCNEPVTFHKETDWGRDTGMISCRERRYPGGREIHSGCCTLNENRFR